MAIEIIIIATMLLLSAIFSGSETALTAASRSRMHQLAKQGNRRADTVNVLRHNGDRLISSLLLGNNLVNILASSLATSVMIRSFGDTGVVYATAVMTILVLIFAEVLPKTYAINNSDKAALFIAPLVRFCVWLFMPATVLVQAAAQGLMYVMGIKHDTAIGTAVSDEELRGAIELHESDSEDGHEKNMLRSILDLEEVEVNEIMVHRKKVQMISIEMPLAQMVEHVLHSAHTRLPVWRDSPDNIVGILHAKDLLRSLQAAGGKLASLDMESILSQPWFIPDTTNLLDQLQMFRQRKEHFALVVDEYGGFEGIVTLEDILEEIVGQIDDEHDPNTTSTRHMEDGSYLVAGDISLRDLNREYDWELPDEEASTIAGLLLHETQKIPRVGQVFRFHGFEFQILRRQRNQITLVRMLPLEKEEQQAAS